MQDMRSGILRGYVVFAVVLVLVAGFVGPPTAAAQEDAAANTTILIGLQPDGGAEWTITMQFVLDTQNDTVAFDRLAAEYTAGNTDILSVEPFEAAAGQATQSTGRPMEITAVTRDADRNASTGQLELVFTWTNFTRVTGNRLELGDVFMTADGTWFPGLTADQELIIEFPRGYAVRSSSRPLQNGSYHVVGPATFTPGNPSAVFVRTGPVGTPTPPPTETSPTPGGIEVTSFLGVGTVLVFLVAIGYLVVRRGRASPSNPGRVDPVVVSESEQKPGDTDNVEPTEPLLSDEERVKRLLRQNGGRMKQVDIVEETDWSNAKVSQLLSEMAERGKIDKLRIGRENLISLPGERPEELE